MISPVDKGLILVGRGALGAGFGLMRVIVLEARRLPQAAGKTVKVISRLLLALPEGYEYRMIFMQRPLP